MIVLIVVRVIDANEFAPAQDGFGAEEHHQPVAVAGVLRAAGAAALVVLLGMFVITRTGSVGVVAIPAACGPRTLSSTEPATRTGRCGTLVYWPILKTFLLSMALRTFWKISLSPFMRDMGIFAVMASDSRLLFSRKLAGICLFSFFCYLCLPKERWLFPQISTISLWIPMAWEVC